MSTAVAVAWAVEAALVTWRDFQQGRTLVGLPPPSDYAATFVVFGGLLAVSSASTQGAATFAGVVAWGLVLASVLNLFDPTLNKNPLKPPGPQSTTPSSSTLPGQPIISQTGASANG